MVCVTFIHNTYPNKTKSNGVKLKLRGGELTFVLELFTQTQKMCQRPIVSFVASCNQTSFVSSYTLSDKNSLIMIR